MYSKKSVGLIVVLVLVIAFLCANVGIGIERVEAAPNGNPWDDLFNPVIVSVAQSNDSPGQGEDVTITAHVINIVGVSSVRLIYDTTEVAMALDSGDENNGYWNGTIPGQTACTTLTIYVTACNTAGNCVSSEPHEKQWRDCSPPEIVAVSQDPEEPCAGEPVDITAHVTDNVGVTSVTLTYDGTTVDMFLDSGSVTDGNWTATIPGQTVGTTLTITIVARDAEGNENTDTHEKRWRDCAPPEIAEVSQDPEEPCAGEPEVITAHVTDNVGVTSVTLTYDGTTVDMSLDSGSASDGNWTATIPGQTVGTTLTITIVARDAEGNENTDTHEKRWRDCAPPEIAEVSQDPEEPCAGEPEVITAHVTDNVGVTSVTLTYDGTTVDMSLDSGSASDGNWTATIPGQTVGTTLTITIIARDAEGNENTDTHEKHWRDCAPPEIVAVSQEPEEPCAGEPVDLTAHITDNVAVASVTLTYDGTTVDMSLDSGSATDGNWTATIPGQTVGTTLTITIIARDAEGNQDTDTHEKHWRDCAPPEIVAISQDPEEPCAGEPVDLTAHITDNVAVASVTLTYDGTTVDMSLDSGSATDGNWTATIPGQTVGTTLTITIVARDAEGNEDTDTHEKHWRDCVPPEVTIISPEEGMTYETTSVDLIYTVNELTSWTGYSLDGAENVTLIGNTTLDELPNGLHNLTIYAEDLTGNAGSNTVNFEIFAIAPTISNIKVTPTYALPGDSINISADIFDHSGILWARAFITKGGEDVWPLFLSGPGGTGGIYTGTWDTMIFIEGGIYNITISATDREGHEALATGPEVEIPIDTEAPIVSDITVSPTPAEPGTPIHISARVFDNLSSVSRVMTHINKEGVSVATVFMSDPDKDGIYTGTWHTMIFTEGGIYNIDISATDNKDNKALAEAPDLKILEIPVDTTAPVISNIAVSPTSAEPGTPIHISAEVCDDLSGVRSVRGIINKEGKDVTTVFMSDPDKDGIYTGTWRTMFSTEGGIYNIDISATDNRGNEALAEAPDVVIPVDTEGPTISDVTVSPSSGPPGTKINISAHVSDPSGVRWVRAIVNKEGEPVMTIFMSPDGSEVGAYTGTWHTMIFTEAGTYSVDISATDGRGNEALERNIRKIEIIS